MDDGQFSKKKINVRFSDVSWLNYLPYLAGARLSLAR